MSTEPAKVIGKSPALEEPFVICSTVAGGESSREPLSRLPVDNLKPIWCPELPPLAPLPLPLASPKLCHAEKQYVRRRREEDEEGRRAHGGRQSEKAVSRREGERKKSEEMSH